MNQTTRAIQKKTDAKSSSQAPSVPKLQDIPASEFADVKVNPVLLRQVVMGYLANQQRSVANTKTRGQVRGGGRKPWRQKGTGRARTGSIRNPIWRGGGTIFGPSSTQDHSRVLPARLRRQVLGAALALKAKAGNLRSLQLTNPLAKTRDIKRDVPSLYSLRKVLLVIPDVKFKTAFRNLPNVTPVLVSRVSALDILSHQTTVFINDTYKQLRSRI